MAARVGTVLSDEHILKECAHYRPIPMKLASKIIDGTNTLKVSPFSSKPLKYQRQLARPEHFDSYAHSLSRNLGNDPEFRGKLHAAYTADVAEHIHQNENAQAEAPRNAPDAFFMNNVLPIIQGSREGFLNPHYNNFVPPAPAAPLAPVGNTYDFRQDPPSNPDDDLESIPEVSDDEDLPPLEEIPDENDGDNVRPSQNENVNVSGMKLRSGNQLHPQRGVKAMKTRGEYTTDPYNTPVNVSDIETQKKRMAAFNLEQSSRHRTKSQGEYTTDPFNIPVNVSDIATNRTRKALFTYEQQRLASQKRQQSIGPNSAYFL